MHILSAPIKLVSIWAQFIYAPMHHVQSPTHTLLHICLLLFCCCWCTRWILCKQWNVAHVKVDDFHKTEFLSLQKWLFDIHDILLSSFIATRLFLDNAITSERGRDVSLAHTRQTFQKSSKHSINGETTNIKSVQKNSYPHKHYVCI